MPAVLNFCVFLVRIKNHYLLDDFDKITVNVPSLYCKDGLKSFKKPSFVERKHICFYNLGNSSLWRTSPSFFSFLKIVGILRLQKWLFNLRANKSGSTFQVTTLTNSILQDWQYNSKPGPRSTSPILAPTGTLILQVCIVKNFLNALETLK